MEVGLPAVQINRTFYLQKPTLRWKLMIRTQSIKLTALFPYLLFLLSYCFCFSAPNFFPSSQSLRNQYFLFQEFPRGPFRCPPWIPFFLRFSRAAFTILAKRFPLHPCPPQRLTFRQVPKPLKNFICKGQKSCYCIK